VPNVYVVCKEHYKDYRLYKNEPWFRELVDTARRQFEIDHEEISMSLGGVGRDKRSYKILTETERKEIAKYLETGIGAASIAKLTGIKVRVIRDYLYRLRKRVTH
jgi:hypothetical protein